MPEKQTQSRAADKPPENWFLDGAKKQIVVVIFAAAWAFYTFVFNSHDSQKDLKYQVDANSKAIEKLIVTDKETSETLNQFLIALTKVSEAQNRLASDVKTVQDVQQRNTEQLMNRK